MDELNSAELPSNTEVLIAPPTIYLAATRSAASEKLLVCAQNIYKASSGAYTGETGPAMLLDVGVNWTLLGHSERRNIFDESVELIGEKTKAAIDTGLSVVFCCGEQLPERESGKTNEVVFGQLAPLKSLGADAWEKIVIAYEPVWAIGTGKVATPEQAQDTHKAIRDWLSKEVSSAVAESTRILYGGPFFLSFLGSQIFIRPRFCQA